MLQVFSKKLLFSIVAVGAVLAVPVYAVCPVCVVAVGAGLGFSRWLGIDDTISSIWIGALLVALIMWTLIWLEKKNWVFPYHKAVVSLAYYLLIFVPLYYAGILGHPLNKIWGIDKIIFGTVAGTIMFLLSYKFHSYLKQKNEGKSFFPYQKVVLPLVILALTSSIFYFLILWRII